MFTSVIKVCTKPTEIALYYSKQNSISCQTIYRGTHPILRTLAQPFETKTRTLDVPWCMVLTAGFLKPAIAGVGVFVAQ